MDGASRSKMIEINKFMYGQQWMDITSITNYLDLDLDYDIKHID